MTWILPSLARPGSLQRFADSYVAAEETARVRVVLASWDPKLNEYDRLDLPKSFKKTICHVEYVNPTLNWAFKRWPNEACYGLVNDDVIIRTKRALSILEEEAGDRWISSGYDGHHRKLVTMPCIGGELARAMGVFVPVGPKSYGGEELWMRICKEFQILRHRFDVVLEHMHHFFGKSENDYTYERAKLASVGFAEEVKKFMDAEYPAIKERVAKLYG